ncbi:MAG TPA: hypothetical protein VLH84_01645 [Patescibacteria group bacterium]|nr:hypothetical protein [Patescibacteria group bacterium]
MKTTESVPRKRRFITVLTVIGILSVAWILHANWRQLFPSAQMKQLRQVEASLHLLRPEHRTEEDIGFNTDGKGAHHFDRYIALTYGDVNPLSVLQGAMSNDPSWHKKSAGDPIGSLTYFMYTKGTGSNMICIGGYTDSENPAEPLYVTIESSGNYDCNPAPGI